MIRPVSLFLVLSAVLALTGCESSEERAERLYQDAVALIARGEVEPALINLANVFDLDGFHKEARQLYADTKMAQGEVQEAYGQYLRLIEQYPDTFEVRATLAEIAMTQGNWAEVERHGQAAIDLAPDDPRVGALAAAIAYRQAAIDRDPAAMSDAADQARTVLVQQPDNQVARRIVINDLVTSDDPAAALPEIDRALEQEPGSVALNEAKLRILVASGDIDAIGAQLIRMDELLPDNTEIRQNLLRWYNLKQDVDGAADYLRQLAERAPDKAGARLDVVQFLKQAGRPADAAAELERLIAEAGEAPEARLYRAYRAESRFYESAGNEDLQEAAIADMRAVLDGAPATDLTRRIVLSLSRMLVATGAEAEAKRLVEEVIAADASNVDALKMRAQWRILEDRPGDAITDLRAALGQAPRDADALTLMAQAHLRDGNRDLANESLDAARLASGNAPAESLRYARFLLQDGRTAPARQVLNDARTVSPRNLELLGMTAEMAMRTADWPGVEEILAVLDGIGSPEAIRQAGILRTTRTLAQSTPEEGLAFLESQVDGEDQSADMAAMALALARIRGGDADGALAALDEALARNPDSPPLRMLRIGINLAAQKTEVAEAELRDILEEAPGAERPLQQLYDLLNAQGRREEAGALLTAGLEAAPRSIHLRMMRAVERIEAEDIEGAIAIFEELYAENSNNVLVANNLATLLGSYREDPADLERASAIARRLRGQNNPAFQDTYGWIEYRRGNFDEALTNLEPAAAGLPGDAMVQYHLAMTYLALERPDKAAEQFRRALDLAGDSGLPQFVDARAELEKLDAAPAE